MYAQDIIFNRLRHSPFRSRFRLKPPEYRYLQQHGLDTVLQHAEGFIASRLAPAFPVNDGKQTPFRGHPVFVAQHATATCCRSCLQKWHGIGAGAPLGTAEVQHIVEVVARWLGEQEEPVEVVRRSARQDPRQGVLPF